ncbi:MAG: cysteine protease, partial [Prevotella nanceiensis]|nr:cysteine protease [Hoylesella nanceiensis]
PHGEYIMEQGVARLSSKISRVAQNMRQRAIESYTTYDQHAMSIVGKAHDKHGKSYYIAKNSWGKNMPFGGFVYLERNFVALRTIAIVTQRSTN